MTWLQVYVVSVAVAMWVPWRKVGRWVRWRLQRPMPDFADRAGWQRALDRWNLKRP